MGVSRKSLCQLLFSKFLCTTTQKYESSNSWTAVRKDLVNELFASVHVTLARGSNKKVVEGNYHNFSFSCHFIKNQPELEEPEDIIRQVLRARDKRGK